MFNVIKKIFGSGNEREISRISKIVDQINSLENVLTFIFRRIKSINI